MRAGQHLAALNELRMLRSIPVFLALLLTVACESSSSRSVTNKQESQTATSSPISLTDEALMAAVKKTAAGFENEPAIHQELAGYPRSDVTARLRRLRDAPATSSREKVAIAFLLCNLDSEIEVNKKVITDALTKEPHSKNFAADWEAELVGRLVEKGHTDLLPTLFSTAEWSDGELSEYLASFFADQVRTAPQEFVLQLSKQPGSVRKPVYTQLQYSELTDTDLDQFRKFANSLTDPNMKSTAREILTAIRNRDSG